MDTGMEHKLKREDVKFKPPNIVTAPPKKGSFGTWGTMLGYHKGFKGSAGEYQYQPDPYDAEHQKAVERAKERKNKEDTAPAAFRPANPPKKGLAGYSGTTMSKYAYVAEGPKQVAVRKVLAEGEQAKEPFRPSNPPKAGYNMTLNKFPLHMHDQYDRKEVARKANLDEQKKKQKQCGERQAFIPSATPKSTRTPSVFRMNIKV